ncbi:MAG: DUF3237 family protein [Anaerolineales bacterium]
MKNNTAITGKLIYEAEIQFTGEIDFGITMNEIISGQKGIPPAGARFDQSFHGTLTGPEIIGSVEGVDYLTVRPDWSFRLHLHGQITTRDGARIAIASQGVSLQSEGSPEAQLRSAVSLTTANEDYQWLNQLQLWALGIMNPQQRTAVIRAFAA